MAVAEMPSASAPKKALLFQEILFALQRFWAERGCVLQQPYDVEVGRRHHVARIRFCVCWGQSRYALPMRNHRAGLRMGATVRTRIALYKHTQFQVILKPPPAQHPRPVPAKS